MSDRSFYGLGTTALPLEHAMAFSNVQCHDIIDLSVRFVHFYASCQIHL